MAQPQGNTLAQPTLHLTHTPRPRCVVAKPQLPDTCSLVSGTASAQQTQIMPMPLDVFVQINMCQVLHILS